MNCPLAFGFEGKVAVFANVRTDICMRSDVLFQHAGLLTADATLSTYVLSPAATSHINILFIGLKPEREEKEIERWEGWLPQNHNLGLLSYRTLILLFGTI